MARIRIVSGATTYYADEIQASNFTIQLNSFSADTAQFLIPRSIQAAALFAAGQPLDIYLGDVRVFTGQIRATPAETMVTGDRHVVNASGGWWWLERLSMRCVGGVRADGAKKAAALVPRLCMETMWRLDQGRSVEPIR